MTSVHLKEWTACADRLRAAIDQQPRPFVCAELLGASWSQSQRDGTAGCIRLLTEARSDARRGPHVYPRLSLLGELITGPDLIDQIVERLRARASSFEYAYWEREDRRSGVRPATGRPYWQLRVSLARERPSNDPVLAFGQPPHHDANTAVAEWLGDDRWNPGEWRVQVPDLRARLMAVRFEGTGALHVTAESTLPAGDLEAHVVLGSGHTRDVGRARVAAPGRSRGLDRVEQEVRRVARGRRRRRNTTVGCDALDRGAAVRHDG